jgi:hypothetical protein
VNPASPRGDGVFAGTRSKEVIQSAPAESGVWSWFAGASIGYLFDYEEEMFHGHLGVDTPWNWGGWRSAFFLEIGFFTGLGYDVTESFEVYSGFRWIYLDDNSIVGAPANGIPQFEDDFLGELGLRFNF